MLSDFFSLYGDVISLDFPEIESDIRGRLSSFDNDWKRYNPKKYGNPRHGLSITSLDGGLSGVPDLDSVKEYNESLGLNYDEPDFDRRTPVSDSSVVLDKVLTTFESLGRSHFIKFSQGGFFPFHRDGNFRLPPKSFRIFCLADGFIKDDFVWIQQDKVLDLVPRRWYVINTFKEHCVFSMSDRSLIVVLNIPATEKNIYTVIDHMKYS